MKRVSVISAFVLLSAFHDVTSQGAEPLNSSERQLSAFIDEHVAQLAPLDKEASLAYWAASLSGKPEDFERVSELELKIRRIYSDRENFAKLKAWKESDAIDDPLLKRQLTDLYLGFLSNQIDPDLMKEMVELGNSIAQRFNTHRAMMDGTTVTLNDITDILTSETDSKRRERAWRASKQVGAVVGPDLIRLVKMRNEAARSLGFENYHTMSLTTSEQSREDLDRIFAELDRLGRDPFTRAKAELDAALAKMYDVDAPDLMPWHYHDPFFQRAPLVYELDLDAYYEKSDVEAVSRRFYNSIGLPVEDILARSDLYEKPGKNPHGFCTDIDREGDVRILCNLRNDEHWMETQLHELGHAVYAKYHDRSLPFLLRTPAHAFATEAVAMFFGRLSRNADWMQEALDLSEADRDKIAAVSDKYIQLQQLVFSRWAMVMYEFEKQLYADPEQDLDALWWELIEKSQQLQKPAEIDEFGWASKLHFTQAACYYHNYMLGELLASQFHQHIVGDVLERESDDGLGYFGEKAVGNYFREEVFAPAGRYHWNGMIERATGEKLTAKHFVGQFAK